jgi:hypothetical protein
MVIQGGSSGPETTRNAQAASDKQLFYLRPGLVAHPVLREATSCTHGSPDGRDGAHRHVRSHRAPTVTEGWYKEFIRRVAPRARSDFDAAAVRRDGCENTASARFVPATCGTWRRQKWRDTRGGRRAFLIASHPRPFCRQRRSRSRSSRKRAQFAATVCLQLRSCVAQFAACARNWRNRRIHGSAGKTVPRRHVSSLLEDVFRMCPRGPSLATQRRPAASTAILPAIFPAPACL